MQFEADSGLPYALVPASVCMAFGVVETRRLEIGLPDGTKLERGVGEVEMSVGGHRAVCPVFIGQRLDRPVMGWVTLEALGLVLDPFTRLIHEMAEPA